MLEPERRFSRAIHTEPQTRPETISVERVSARSLTSSNMTFRPGRIDSTIDEKDDVATIEATTRIK